MLPSVFVAAERCMVRLLRLMLMLLLVCRTPTLQCTAGLLSRSDLLCLPFQSLSGLHDQPRVGCTLAQNPFACFPICWCVVMMSVVFDFDSLSLLTCLFHVSRHQAQHYSRVYKHQTGDSNEGADSACHFHTEQAR